MKSKKGITNQDTLSAAGNNLHNHLNYFAHIYRNTPAHTLCAMFSTPKKPSLSSCVFYIIINLFLFELSVDAGVAGIDLIEENVELQ